MIVRGATHHPTQPHHWTITLILCCCCGQDVHHRQPAHRPGAGVGPNGDAAFHGWNAAGSDTQAAPSVVYDVKSTTGVTRTLSQCGAAV